MDSDSTGVSAKLKLLERELANLEQLSSGDASKIPSSMRKQAKRYQSLAAKVDDLRRRMVSRPSTALFTSPTILIGPRCQSSMEEHPIINPLLHSQELHSRKMPVASARIFSEMGWFNLLLAVVLISVAQQVSDPGEPTLGPEFRTQRQTEFLLEVFHLQQRAAETRQKLTALQTETARGSAAEELSGQAKLSTRKSMDSIKTNFKEIQRSLEVWLARIMGDLEGILARNGVSRVKDYCISRYPVV